MNILIKRIYTCKTYTISHVYIDGSYICDAIEDADRMLDQSMKESEILSKKVMNETAIPTGEYKVTLTYSPKFAKRKWALKYNSKVPLINDVPCWSGVRIHPSNYASELSGCIAPGLNKIKGAVLDSTNTYYKIMDNYIMPAVKRKEPIYIEINNDKYRK